MFFLSFLFTFSQLFSSSSSIISRLGITEDIPDIKTMFNDIVASDDKSKLVILPYLYQEASLVSAINSKKLFVATCSDNKPIAYKKLFLLLGDEKSEILTSEIRCNGDFRKIIDKAYLSVDLKCMLVDRTVIFNDTPVPDLMDIPVFYTGADYVKPLYRCQGVNTLLYSFSFEELFKEYFNSIANAQAIGLVYGLSHANDYDDKGNGKSRTPMIAKLFLMALLKYKIFKNQLYHYRFASHMPQFDLAASECIPLSDEHSIKGYGNVIIAVRDNK